MEIEHIIEQGSGDLNEDALVLEDTLFGVFDGASSLGGELFENNTTGGMMASKIAGTVFSKNHFPLMQLGEKANSAILSKMLAHEVDLSCRHKLWSTSAAVVRLFHSSFEWLQTGDAQIIVIYADGSHKVLVEQDDHDYETLVMLKKHSHMSSEFRQQVKKIRLNMNRTYGVFNGEPDALDFISSGFLPLEDVKTILLFTDGLQIPSPTPEKKKNFTPLVELYQRYGLSGLRDHVRTMEALDPDIKQFPRFKCHDDLAAIAIHP